MQNRRILVALTGALVYGLGVASVTMADTIVVDDQVKVRDSDIDKPRRGITMSQVEAKFGAPTTKHDAVGLPPITRWDYPSFSVFFERDRVIDSVVTTGEAAPHAPDSAAPAASAPASDSASSATNPTG